MNKYRCFLKNTKELQEKMGIVPLLYGSLGLEVLTGDSLNSDDIDILIPKENLEEKWKDFQKYLESLGYTLIDEHEHTFEKEGIHYSYASIENLEDFAGIKTEDIGVQQDEGVVYGLLDIVQYLKVYEASLKDSYRQDKKNKQDSKKVEMIEDKIKNR